MADAPFSAVGVTEQPCGGEEEPAPAPHPQARVAAVNLAKNAFDLVAVGIKIAEPLERGALIMRAAPAPFLLDLEQIRILPDQMMAWHHPAVEEMLRDPVLTVSAIESIGARTMGIDMQEEAAVGREPRSDPRHQFAPVDDVLEHFNRDDAVELPLRLEPVDVRRGHAKIFQSAHRGLPLDIFALRLRIRYRRNLRIWKLPRHPQRQRTPAAAEFENRLPSGKVG